jgi:hypothetical protein
VVVLAAMASFLSWPPSWPPGGLDTGDQLPLYGALGLMLLAALGLARWAQEV